MPCCPGLPTRSHTRLGVFSSVTASGQVRPQTKVDIASDVAGKIVKLAVREGQMVTVGQLRKSVRDCASQSATGIAAPKVTNARER